MLLASGYRGAMVKIVGLFQAPWWVPFKVADRARYRARLPNAFASSTRAGLPDYDAGVGERGPHAPSHTRDCRMTVPYTLAVAMLALICPDGILRFILSLIWVNWYQRW